MYGIGWELRMDAAAADQVPAAGAISAAAGMRDLGQWTGNGLEQARLDQIGDFAAIVIFLSQIELGFLIEGFEFLVILEDEDARGRSLGEWLWRP